MLCVWLNDEILPGEVKLFVTDLPLITLKEYFRSQKSGLICLIEVTTSWKKLIPSVPALSHLSGN